jgi:hypothetical protein
MLGRMCLQAGWVSEECVGACSTHRQVVRYYEMSIKKVSWRTGVCGSIPQHDNIILTVIPIEDLPEDTPVVDPIWSMKRKKTKIQ